MSGMRWFFVRALGPLAAGAFVVVVSSSCDVPPPEGEVQSTQAAVVTFPLVCRSGGATNSEHFQLLQHSTGGTQADHQLIFMRAGVAAGAGGANLPPGTCAWVDRPVAASEPGQICVSGFSFDWTVRSNTRSFPPLRASWISAVSPGSRAPAVAGWIDLMFGDASVVRTFNVFNDFGGCFRTP